MVFSFSDVGLYICHGPKTCLEAQKGPYCLVCQMWTNHASFFGCGRRLLLQPVRWCLGQMVPFRSVTSWGKGHGTWSRCLSASSAAGFLVRGRCTRSQGWRRGTNVCRRRSHRSLCWGTGRDEWGASHSKGHGKEQSLGTGGRGPGRERKSSASQQRAPSVG